MRIAEIVEAVNGTLFKGELNGKISGISTDSRGDCKDKLFIPLTGKKFNGHNYINAAVDRGACAILFSENNIVLPENIIAIKVKDTLKALGDIAKYHIEKNKIKVIGITGSAGKTTTKELLKFVTGFKGTEKNYNNLIGVPLTILNADKNDKYLILEMGTNIKGEMARLTEIATPEYVLITNIGYGHIEGFGSIENVYGEKSAIIKNNNDLEKVFINSDNEILKEKLKKSEKFKKIKDKVICFGSDKEATVRLLTSESNLQGNKIEFSYKQKNFKTVTKLLGKFNALNVLSVFGISKELGFDTNHILSRIEAFTPMDMRGNIIKSSKSFTVINDCYNANFESFKESVNLFNGLKTSGDKYLVVGDMFELGSMSDSLHKDLGRIISDTEIKYILAHGEKAKKIITKINVSKHFVKYFNDKKEIIYFLKNSLKTDDTVLIKASRGMNFEEIVEGIV